jgi:hypothetical protein
VLSALIREKLEYRQINSIPGHCSNCKHEDSRRLIETKKKTSLLALKLSQKTTFSVFCTQCKCFFKAHRPLNLEWEQVNKHQLSSCVGGPLINSSAYFYFTLTLLLFWLPIIGLLPLAYCYVFVKHLPSKFKNFYWGFVIVTLIINVLAFTLEDFRNLYL